MVTDFANNTAATPRAISHETGVLCNIHRNGEKSMDAYLLHGKLGDLPLDVCKLTL